MSSHRPRSSRTAALIATAALGLVVATPSAARSDTVPDLDRPALRAAIAGLPDPQLSAAQVRVAGPAGRFNAAGGVRDLATNRPAPADGRFRIASATKMFTAVLALQLADAERLDLAAPVQHYLPRLLPASYPPIPVGSLLDHTSGLPASTEDAGQEDAAYYVAHRFDHHTPRQVVATATEHPMEFEPGSAQHYNGVNYFIAGLVIERVTGSTYADQLRRRILRPLHLRDTSLPRPREYGVRGRHAHTYVKVDGVPVDVTARSSYGWAESGLISTTADLTRFLRAAFRGPLLGTEARTRLFTVPDVPYVGDNGCARGPEAGPPACFSMGLTRTELPNGLVVWGKSGGFQGNAIAAFATRDLSRVLTYALHPTGNRDGSEGERIRRIVTGAFLKGGPAATMEP
ncbi:MAG TPA: serine hydrolase domain-containing protein [Nocardioides sp.]|nr:serine hydrolase domain-containing protein [Nocardioides sp.]